MYVDENNISVTTVKANDIDGDDSNLFDIDKNGTITFKQAPDFEDPKDSDRDNKYNITIKVSDTKSTISRDLLVVVRNLSFFEKKLIEGDFEDLIDVEFYENNILVLDDTQSATKVYDYNISDNFSKSLNVTSSDYYPLDMVAFDNKIFISYDSGNLSSYDSSESVLDDDCQNGFKLLSSDIDDDGKDDLVATCGNEVKWYKQEDNGVFTQKNITNGNYPYDIVTLGSGHKDILVSSPHEGSIIKLKNDLHESFTKEVVKSDIDVGKIYQDNTITYFLSPNENKISIIKSGVVSVLNNPQNIVTPNSLAVDDIDGDGLKDIVVTTEDDMKLLWYKNLGNSKYKEHLIFQFESEPKKVLIKDLNNDGKKDIVVGTKKGLFVFYKNSKENNLINF